VEGGEELGQFGQWSAGGVGDPVRLHALSTNQCAPEFI
jgi:hypothetical protein